MPTTIDLAALTLPVGFCPATYQALLNQFVASMTAVMPGTFTTWNYGTAIPGDITKPWLEIDANGKIKSVSNWNALLGLWDSFQGAPYFGVTTGAANAYALTILDRDITSLAQINGRMFIFQANFTNTGAATLAITGNPTVLAAIPLSKFFNVALGSGDIQSGQFILCSYSSTSNTFQILSQIGGAETHGVQIYNTGAGNFTVPSAVYSVKSTCIGAGGGGGGLNGSSRGGGGGGCAIKYLTVVPGQLVAYVIGVGGLKGDSTIPQTATNGSDTTFNASIIGGGGKNGDVGLGAGGTASGGDINLIGEGGGMGGYGRSQIDKPSGGKAPLSFGFQGGEYNGVFTLPTIGCGGYGDYDAGGGFVGQNGAAGYILLEW